ncbi:MAG: ATP-dependent Clp protease adaptor ClpS [Spirochaetota bacterium]
MIYAGLRHTITNSLADKTETEHDIEIREPSMYRVIMHNDHYTTMQFVVEVIMTVFHKSEEEASRLMLQIHNTGSAVCGVYILDIAQTKVNHVHMLAKREGFPLKCTLEEV